MWRFFLPFFFVCVRERARGVVPIKDSRLLCHPSSVFFYGLLRVRGCETVDRCGHGVWKLTSFVSPIVFLHLWLCHVGIRRRRYSRPALIVFRSVLRRRSQRGTTPTASGVFFFRFSSYACAIGPVSFSRFRSHVFCVTLRLSSFVDCCVFVRVKPLILVIMSCPDSRLLCHPAFSLICGHVMWVFAVIGIHGHP